MSDTVRERRNGEVIHRDGMGDLVFKVKADALVGGSVVSDPKLLAVAPSSTVTPPRTAPGEQVAWWEWTQAHVDFRLSAMEEAIGQALGMKAAELRRTFTAEVDLLRRQLAQLRSEFDADRNLKHLHAEVAAARADIPKLPDLEAKLAAKHAEARREIASLKRELAATRERLTLVHTELGAVRYQVGKSPKPVVTISLSTSDSTFVVEDGDPSASAAWQRFMENVVESNPDATAQIEGRVNGTAKN